MAEVIRMTEKLLSQAVFDLARLNGWLVSRYPTWLPTRTTPGFPDLVMVRDGRLLVVELKADGKHMTAAQEAWMREFAKAGVEWRVWRPADWHAGVINRELMRNKEET